MNVGIVCGCLPAVPALFKKHKATSKSLGYTPGRNFGSSADGSGFKSPRKPSTFKSFHGTNVNDDDYVELVEMPKGGLGASRAK
jgi:hypothetical protein